MISARSETAAVVINGLIYVPGGYGNERALEVYDPAQDSWRALAQMPEGRHHLMTTAHNGKVYVFGVAVNAGLVPLVVVGVLNSVVSIYYYLRVTIAMYMQEPHGEPVQVAWAAPAVLAILATLGLTLWWGVQAHDLLVQAQRSIFGLL